MALKRAMDGVKILNPSGMHVKAGYLRNPFGKCWVTQQNWLIGQCELRVVPTVTARPIRGRTWPSVRHK